MMHLLGALVRRLLPVAPRGRYVSMGVEVLDGALRGPETEEERSSRHSREAYSKALGVMPRRYEDAPAIQVYAQQRAATPAELYRAEMAARARWESVAGITPHVPDYAQWNALTDAGTRCLDAQRQAHSPRDAMREGCVALLRANGARWEFVKKWWILPPDMPRNVYDGIREMRDAHHLSGLDFAPPWD